MPMTFLTEAEEAILAMPDLDLEPDAETVEPESPATESPVAKTPVEPAMPVVAQPEPVAPEATEAPVAVTAPPQADAPPPVPTLDTTQLQQAAGVLQQVDTARDALAQRYETGEIGFAEYRRADRQLEQQAQQAQSFLTEAQINARIAEAQAQTTWNDAVRDFRTDPANQVFESATLLPMMQTALESIRRNQPSLSSRAQLAAAKSEVQASLRAVLGLEAPVAKGIPPAPKKPGVVPSLGALPVAQAAEGDGEFTYLESLRGLELEKALAKLPRDQREQWAMVA